MVDGDNGKVPAAIAALICCTRSESTGALAAIDFASVGAVAAAAGAVDAGVAGVAAGVAGATRVTPAMRVSPVLIVEEPTDSTMSAPIRFR